MSRPDSALPAHDRLFGDCALAAIVEARAAGTALADFWAQNRDGIEELTGTYPAILFRGFAMRTDDDFAQLRPHAIGTPAEYVYRSTPRTEVGSGVMTATEYPPAETIPVHCENAYQQDWPLRLLFGCIAAPAEGGQTPLADMRAVTDRIGADTMAEFARRGVRYLRTYHPGFDLDWRTVFQTDDEDGVARYCRAHGISLERRTDGTLRTEQACQGTARHPVTGEELWFNQAHLFHPSALGEAMMADMIDIFGPDDLPRDARFGDNAPIPEDTLARIRDAHTAETRQFDWQSGDVMLIDNMLTAHGRRPFSGPRRILVSMGQMMSERMPASAGA